MRETSIEEEDLVAKVFAFTVIIFVLLSIVPIALSF
jgi:hypothetical protein